MLELTSGPSSTPVCSRVRYAAASQDPFLLAATEASRSRSRRRSFRLALRHVDNAAAAVENNRWQLSAVSLLAAHHHSEGFIELNETFRSLVIAKDIERPHELDGERHQQMRVGAVSLHAGRSGVNPEGLSPCRPHTRWQH
jgi:hypothetical protein